MCLFIHLSMYLFIYLFIYLSIIYVQALGNPYTTLIVAGTTTPPGRVADFRPQVPASPSPKRLRRCISDAAQVQLPNELMDFMMVRFQLDFHGNEN